MSSAYRRLREAFKTIPPKPDPLATRHLRNWMHEHADELAAAKPDAEFNGTMMQGFHWYSDGDGKHWNRLRQRAPDLAAVGISAIWFPPATKGMGGPYDVGYGIYDLFDLGEFVHRVDVNPQGEKRTKYGTRDEYIAAVEACREHGIQVYADVVFNHKMGGEYEEAFEAIPFDPANRTNALQEARTIRSYTGFNFPGRGDRYSAMKWHWWHFGAVDYNSLDPGFRAVWRMRDTPFNNEVDLENGNYDYLMGCDLNVDHPEVRDELIHWGKWMLETAPISGFRLDAIKHIEGDFFNDWLDRLEAASQRDLFCVGEYWTPRLDTLSWYIGNTGGRLHLFDAPLQGKFHQVSRAGGNFDMRTILDGTLMKEFPLFAVTLVENHDTQPLQQLESVVDAWFKPLAYAIILLRAEGYPCIFEADYYGAEYVGKGRDGNDHEISLACHRWIIDRLLLARRHFAHGPQYDSFDDFDIIGWTRQGTANHPHPMAVLLSDGPAGTKWMEVGKPNSNFEDITGHVRGLIRSNEFGWAEFRCGGGSVSVWVEHHAELAGLIGAIPG
ncbi:MAG: alpha-amylase [Verrucomicrobiota bacterium]